MPRTHGDSLIHLDRIDVLTETECPLGELAHPPGKEIAVNIAAYVAAIIEDGSTLQIGMGAVPDQVLRLLGDRRHLSIHTDLLTDGVIDLIHSGAVTGRHEDLFRERIVASYCLGTQRLYDFVDDNPLFCFLPIEQVCAPETLARTGRLVSLTQAEAIDLAGQVCVNDPARPGLGRPRRWRSSARRRALRVANPSFACRRRTPTEPRVSGRRSKEMWSDRA